MSDDNLDLATWAQAMLTALNTGDVQSGSKLHLKLREVMINHRANPPQSFLRRYRVVNVKRAKEDFHTYDEPGAGILYMAAALAGEAGEYGELILISMLNAKIGSLCNLIKKQERSKIGGPDHGFTTKIKDITPEKLRDEIGGIFIYLDLLAALLDVDLEEAATETFNNVSVKIGSDYRV